MFRKAAYEAVFYGRTTADALGVECHALVIGKNEKAGDLGVYGAHKVHHVGAGVDVAFDAQVYAAVISEAVVQLGSNVVVLAYNADGKSLTGRLGVRLNAGVVSGVNTLPDTAAGFAVGKSVFGGKATETINITSDVKVVSVMPNSLSPQKMGAAVSAESIEINIPESKINVVGRDTLEGVVPLPEADLVVSAGRGMKAAENWGIIEELADILNATTACSRPVADVGWRPHHEHVGQTGIAIRPNLYVAIGISGAIQHLAGVNNSKVIVVINKDSEAPFFKAADYGVCADLFDVVPKLIESLRKFKAVHN
jgi:electron transfer flavoprotein alpha subunit